MIKHADTRRKENAEENGLSMFKSDLNHSSEYDDIEYDWISYMLNLTPPC